MLLSKRKNINNVNIPLMVKNEILLLKSINDIVKKKSEKKAMYDFLENFVKCKEFSLRLSLAYIIL